MIATDIDEAADIHEGMGGWCPLAPSLFHICKSATATSLISPFPFTFLPLVAHSVDAPQSGRLGAMVASLRYRAKNTILAVPAAKQQCRLDLRAVGAK